MLTPVLGALDTAHFKITPVMGPASIALKLAGSCDSASLTALTGFLGKLHGEAVRASVKEVVLDCENLYFLNSGSIKCFVTWLAKLSALPEGQRYAVTVRTNRLLAWQQRTFGTVQRSAPQVVILES